MGCLTTVPIDSGPEDPKLSTNINLFSIQTNGCQLFHHTEKTWLIKCTFVFGGGGMEYSHCAHSLNLSIFFLSNIFLNASSLGHASLLWTLPQRNPYSYIKIQLTCPLLRENSPTQDKIYPLLQHSSLALLRCPEWFLSSHSLQPHHCFISLLNDTLKAMYGLLIFV